MLSKVLRGEDAGTAQSMPWRHVAGSGTPKPPRAPVQALVPNKAPIRQIITTDDQVSILQERIGELERTMEQRTAAARDAGYREAELKTRTQVTSQVEPVLEKLAKSIHELAELRS